MRKSEAAAILPGGIVRQRRELTKMQQHDLLRGILPPPGVGDCFSACVSMLTGIDIELLPVLPPQMMIVGGSSLWSHFTPLRSRFDAWRRLLADNGFKLTLRKQRPKQIPFLVILVALPCCHVAVAVSDKHYVDPSKEYKKLATDEEYDLLYQGKYYATVTPI